MHILIAPDKFKGCLSAKEVADAMSAGVFAAVGDVEVSLCPISDGGEGFVDAIVRGRGGTFRTTRVTGPLPEMKVDARWAIVPPNTAVIEMSAASGLALLPENLRDPEATTTFGTGELLVAAAKAGCTKILLGVGGSATIDGGIGCCQAAGLPVILDGGEPTSMTEPPCGRDLSRVARIKSHRGGPLEGVEIVVACDVTTPLFGAHGAAKTFGPQKGASPEQAERFDQALRQIATRCAALDVAQIEGAGAAGGLAFGLAAFAGAKLVRGARLVLDEINFASHLSNGVHLCITGEGRIDESSRYGKAPAVVAEMCQERQIRCVAIAGSVDRSTQAQFDETISLTGNGISEEQARRDARKLIGNAVFKLVTASAVASRTKGS